MKKISKIIVAILGGVNNVFSIAIPIFISLLIIDKVTLNPFNQMSIMIIGILSCIYRALSVWMVK